MGTEGNNGQGESVSAGGLPGKAHRNRSGQPVAEVHPALAEHVIRSVETDSFLSLKALAEYSSLSVRTLRHFIHELPPERALPCYRLPGKLLVRRSEFDAWLEQYRSRGRPSLVKALRELGLPHGA